MPSLIGLSFAKVSMDINDTSIDDPGKELAYYKRQLDELAGENLRQDYNSSALVHELRQRRQGFAILFQLQLSFGLETPLENIFEVTLRSINATLDMDKSIVLMPTEVENTFLPLHWFGFQGSVSESLDTLRYEIPPEMIDNSGYLLVNRAASSTPLIETLRRTLELPYFIGIPVVVDGSVVCLFIAGRLFEKKPFRPPLDNGDLDTLRAIASLISRSIQNKQFAALTEERSKIISLFGQQVSQAIVDELLRGKIEMASRRRHVCIMFLDIRNFTPMCEGLEPEEVVSYLNALFEFMIEIINRHHGIINQFVGDGFMATFGAPISHGNDCREAVDAAFEILDCLKQSCDAGSILPTRIGIGLHAGEAVTGNVGSVLRKQYTITGNVVILASRIEQLNKEFGSQLLISEAVWDGIGRDREEAMPLGPVHVKGRHDPISLYRLA